MEGRDDDKTDILLNPARALVGTYSENKAMADTFAEWIASQDGGQKVVSEFAANGVVLYTKTPQEMPALGVSKPLIISSTDPSVILCPERKG